MQYGHVKKVFTVYSHGRRSFLHIDRLLGLLYLHLVGKQVTASRVHRKENLRTSGTALSKQRQYQKNLTKCSERTWQWVPRNMQTPYRVYLRWREVDLGPQALDARGRHAAQARIRENPGGRDRQTGSCAKMTECVYFQEQNGNGTVFGRNVP